MNVAWKLTSRTKKEKKRRKNTARSGEKREACLVKARNTAHGLDEKHGRLRPGLGRDDPITNVPAPATLVIRAGSGKT